MENGIMNRVLAGCRQGMATIKLAEHPRGFPAALVAYEYPWVELRLETGQTVIYHCDRLESIVP